jgi:hypothetical protein
MSFDRASRPDLNVENYSQGRTEVDKQQTDPGVLAAAVAVVVEDSLYPTRSAGEVVEDARTSADPDLIEWSRGDAGAEISDAYRVVREADAAALEAATAAHDRGEGVTAAAWYAGGEDEADTSDADAACAASCAAASAAADEQTSSAASWSSSDTSSDSACAADSDGGS